MNRSLSEELTDQFYQWEIRGRGRNFFDFPVELEPEFFPFVRFLPRVKNGEATSPSVFKRIVSVFQTKEVSPPEEEIEFPPVCGYEFKCDENLVCLSITVPKSEKILVEDMGRVLLMLSSARHPVSFEVLGSSTKISFQFVCRESDSVNLYSTIKSFFPAVIVSPKDLETDILGADYPTFAIEFGLDEEFMRPVLFAENAKFDPYLAIVSAMEKISENETGGVQILFQGAVNPWSESILRSVKDGEGGSFFLNAPEMVKLAQQKISSPLFAVCVRTFAQSPLGNRAVAIAKSIGDALVKVTRSEANSVVVLSHSDEYPLQNIFSDIAYRESHRLGMILNTQELATLVHFPSQQILSPKLERLSKKTKGVDKQFTNHNFILGVNEHLGNEVQISVPSDVRLCHTHVIGATGTGKSTFLLSMIAQDIVNGNGFAVLDPHGDLIESVLPYIPKDRLNDVIIIDPADGEYPVGFNILSAHSEIEKDILSSDLVASFKRLSTSWGDQMNSVFANAILAFLENPDGGTLVDLRRFLVEKSFRETFLKKVKDPHVVYYWQHEYPLLKSSSIGSILTRLDTFLRPKLIRNMVAQKKSLDFEMILDTKKILLIKLSQGLIGAENSFLLGTFFVSKMYQSAMARQAKAKADRSDFFLYIDEFQNFITPSMSYILSGARKYHLGLILAHQDMQQLAKYDTELASSVVVNAGTRICFRLGDTDAKRFANGFSYFDEKDLENLKTGEAIARIDQPNYDFNLTTIPPPELKTETTPEQVINASRHTYGTPKDVVEQSLAYLGNLTKEELKEQPKEPIITPPPKPQPEPVEQKEPLPEEPPTSFVPVEIKVPVPPKKKVETEHRYLQTLIKRMAESRGFKAQLEELTPDGKGRVDVSLERNGKKIAVEISVTTTDEWESHNVEKCLSAGYDLVMVCSNNFKHLEKIKTQLVAKLKKVHQNKVMVFEPNEAILYFDEQIVWETTTEKVVKGYRVKVEYDSSSNQQS